MLRFYVRDGSRTITRTVGENDLISGHLVIERVSIWAKHVVIYFKTTLDPICISFEESIELTSDKVDALCERGDVDIAPIQTELWPLFIALMDTRLEGPVFRRSCYISRAFGLRAPLLPGGIHPQLLRAGLVGELDIYDAQHPFDP